MTDQPTLRDGELVLRPWTLDDSERTRPLHDDEIARWFDFPAVTPAVEEHRAWITRTRAEWSERSKVTFLVEWRGQPAGTVDVRVQDAGVGVLSWAVYAPFRGQGLAWRAVRAARRSGPSRRSASNASRPTSTPATAPPCAPPCAPACAARGCSEATRRSPASGRTPSCSADVATTRTRGPARGSPRCSTRRCRPSGPSPRASCTPRPGTCSSASSSTSASGTCPAASSTVTSPPPPASCARCARSSTSRCGAGPLLAVNWLPALHGWADATVFVFDLGTVDASRRRATRTCSRARSATCTGPDRATGPGRVAAYNERLLTALHGHRGARGRSTSRTARPTS